jgi:hypothetical protein
MSRPSPKTTADSAVVYAGRQFAGAVRVTPKGFVARDPDGRRIAVFPTLRAASDALITELERKGRKPG